MRLTVLTFLVTIGTTRGGIIGSDSRTPVINTSTLPHSAIGIVTTELGTCTGTMIGQNTMITAFHCLHFDNRILQPLSFTTTDKHWSAGIDAHWAISDLETQFTGGINDTVTAFDFAIVRLTGNLGDSTGWMTVGEFIGEYNNPWNVSGYKQNSRTQSHEQALITGHTLHEWNSLRSYNIRTNADFTLGQSGSPLYKLINGTYTIMAVMSTMQAEHNEGAGGTLMHRLANIFN